VQSNKMTPAQSDEILDRIIPTQNIEEVSDCDLVIETVFENDSLKKRITKETEVHMHSDALLATNTSTLGISDLATASSQPQNYVGLHFFSPVTRIPLVEIVKGEKTSNETVARAFDFVRQLKKTPIIIEDSLAFYTTRISRVYMLEAFGMLLEGQSPISIEQAALQAGMVYSPLVLADALGLPNILALEAKVIQLFGEEYKKLKGINLVEQLVNEFSRKGKQYGAGFYDYTTKNRRTEIWENWEKVFPHNPVQIPQTTIMERLLFVQCLEAVRCMDNGMIKTSAEANLGSIYGAGFADFKGGALQYINDYGVVEFTTRAKELATLYGFNFNPPDSLIEMAEKQVNFS
jgi:3-hydroxyacyl-CoA dehydrogenase/enoyl-CoA hydratase/3-hydroxybutyryl-CoA epimerase